jgi:exodeoxyribonuclease VII small subunit
MTGEMSYQDALVELEGLLKRIESDATSLDDLARDVERAASLIAFCRERIRATEIRVRDIFEGMSPEG